MKAIELINYYADMLERSGQIDLCIKTGRCYGCGNPSDRVHLISRKLSLWCSKCWPEAEKRIAESRERSEKRRQEEIRMANLNIGSYI